MIKTGQLMAAIVSGAVLAGAPAGPALAAGRDTRIKVAGFVGVPANMTGPAGNFAGFPGGGLPWSIGEAEVTIKGSGKVEVEFQNLIFADGANAGRNTLPMMWVGVSCASLAPGSPRVAAVSDPFVVTTADQVDAVGGDADARTRIALPVSCVAPIVFITNNPAQGATAAWFAVDAL
jgi:hypothetical protein